jgi:hypothetical protein
MPAIVLRRENGGKPIPRNGYPRETASMFDGEEEINATLRRSGGREEATGPTRLEARVYD